MAPATVVKATRGTVRAVENTDEEKEDGMMDPDEMPVDSVHGTVNVVTILTVVTGTVGTAPEQVEAAVTMAGFEEMCAAQIPWK